jgi:hypothetical protein
MRTAHGGKSEPCTRCPGLEYVAYCCGLDRSFGGSDAKEDPAVPIFMTAATEVIQQGSRHSVGKRND